MNKEASNLLAKLVTEIYKNEQLQQKVKQLETNIGEVMEILNQPMLNYASCVKALDEIEEILKRGK